MQLRAGVVMTVAKRRPTLATTCIEARRKWLKHADIKTASAAKRYRRLMSRRRSHHLPSAPPPQSVMMLLPWCRRCPPIDFNPAELLGYLSLANVNVYPRRLTPWLGHRWCYRRPVPSVLHGRWSSFGKADSQHSTPCRRDTMGNVTVWKWVSSNAFRPVPRLLLPSSSS